MVVKPNKCLYCGQIVNKGSCERFCSPNCRKRYWAECRNNIRPREVEQLLKIGFTYKEIGEKLGITKQMVGLYAKSYNLQRRGTCIFKAYEGYEHKDSKNGYIRIYHDGKFVQKHRLVMEQQLGRPLLLSELVHHINGDRTDNRPQNLQLLTSKTHMVKTNKCHGCLVMKENKRLRARVRELERFLQPALDKV